MHGSMQVKFYEVFAQSDLFLCIWSRKCVKKIQFVCSHKTQLSAKLSLFFSYNDMFRPTITASSHVLIYQQTSPKTTPDEISLNTPHPIHTLD